MKKNIIIPIKFLLTVFIVMSMTSHILTANILIVHGAATYEKVSSFIYHNHIGDETTKSGCYQNPVYHNHGGSKESGGDCYQSIVYHTHQGSSTQGGSCYSIPGYHAHEGDGTASGGCYQAKNHSHSSSCYRTDTCSVTAADITNCTNTWTEYCYHHGQTNHGTWNGRERHSSCGAGTVNTTFNMCNSCMYAPSSTHNYNVLNCSKGGQIEGYVLACGMTEATIDYYDAGCGKGSQDIESYALSCSKTNDSIDKYGISCGKDKSTPIGSISIINKTIGSESSVKLEGIWEDKTSGELASTSQPYLWVDAKGNEISRSNTITVTENGYYTLKLQLSNADVDKNSLSVTMQVKNVRNQNESGNQGGNNNNGNDSNSGNHNSNNNGNGDNAVSGSDEVSSSDEYQEKTALLPEASATPKAISELIGNTVGTLQNQGLDEQGGAKKGGADFDRIRKRILEKAQEQGYVKGDIQKESDEVLPVINLSEPEIDTSVQLVKSNRLTAMAVVKGVVLTLSAVLAGVLIGIVLAFFIRGIVIYNEDPEGKQHFMGIVFAGKEGDHFTICMPKSFEHKVYTNYFCLKPGILFCIRHNQEEMFVTGGKDDTTVFIEDEIYVTIPF